MKVPMTIEILTIIDYIKTQRKAFAILHNEIIPSKIDYIQRLREIYNNLPLPDEMNTSNACFESVLYYPLTKEIMNTQYEDLPDKFYFGY